MLAGRQPRRAPWLDWMLGDLSPCQPASLLQESRQLGVSLRPDRQGLPAAGPCPTSPDPPSRLQISKAVAENRGDVALAAAEAFFFCLKDTFSSLPRTSQPGLLLREDFDPLGGSERFSQLPLLRRDTPASILVSAPGRITEAF